MEEIRGQNTYQIELFERLRRSVSLKKAEECFGCIIKPAFWWIIDKPNPKTKEIEDLLKQSYHSIKKIFTDKSGECLNTLAETLKKSAEHKKLLSFDCMEDFHGFVFPIAQGDKIYGYIGACYSRKEISSEALQIFPAFADTIVKEVQKEIELSKLYETLRPRAIALSTVHTVHRLISSTLDLGELLPRIARLSLQIMRAQRCSVKLVDSKRKLLLPKVTVDLRAKKIRLKKVKVGMWAPGKAFKYGRPVRARDYLATPLIDEDIIGVITLYDKIDKKPFTAFDQEIMSTMAEQAVIAIKNAQLYKEQERLTMGTIKALAKVLDTRAPGTYVPRVSSVKIAQCIGQEQMMDADSLKSLEYASVLHDAGEVFVPKAVLAKPTKLTGKEYKMVKAHPAAGVEIIKHIKALKGVTPIIMYHHENYDGSGYPKGLKKDQIPLGARIMAIVSAFEAMISKKPYRAAKSINEAVMEVSRNSGTQFDPKVVDSFLNVMRRKDIKDAIRKDQRESGYIR
ncbi:MAG: HD domain-containing protein [Candidatus Omnitrophica bacterium]|nr:HD domain-containing protein [Candidatus Omnitrophota bacterium]